MTIGPKLNIGASTNLALAPEPRADILDLIGPQFDRPRGEPAANTLIICAAPRTGSYELARMLMAAGIGIAHEYFNPHYAEIAASRWGFSAAPLSIAQIGNYILEVRCRRSAGGVFATKLQYWQYEASLRNAHGSSLFEGAVVVHLFRADVFGQLVSLLNAMETGRFGFSGTMTYPPENSETLLSEARLLTIAETLAMEDAGFRRLFMVSGIRPIFVEFHQLVREPRSVIETIGQALAVPPDHAGLEKALALSGPYRAEPKTLQRQQRVLEILRKFAFQSVHGH